MSIIYAPFTPEQVALLNGFQQGSNMHPFTCGGDGCRRAHPLEHTSLYAAEDGWHCRYCDYSQNWAHDFMADGCWVNYARWPDDFYKPPVTD